MLRNKGSSSNRHSVAELYETVTNLYGEEFDKLVYTLNIPEQEDDRQEKQKLILRYDLTVSLARYVSSYNLKQFRRYQIGKVYRRDNPQIQKGRYREFYQCDFDIIGDDQNSNTYDLEMISTMHDILDKLVGKTNVVININHKNIVLHILKMAHVPEKLFGPVCSALDKLDKKIFSDIVPELKEKGLSEESINKLNHMYQSAYDPSCDNSLDPKTMQTMKTIIKFTNDMHYKNFVTDPFLIRGLDYYTGIVYEATYNDLNIMQTSIASGGRYDKMIEKFTGSSIPAIGMSLGVERIAKILEMTQPLFSSYKPSFDVYIASIGESSHIEKIKLCSELRSLGVKATMSHIAAQKMRHQFDIIFEYNIPYMITIGETEIQNNTIRIKNIKNKKQCDVAREKGINYFSQKNDIDINKLIDTDD